MTEDSITVRGGWCVPAETTYDLFTAAPVIQDEVCATCGHDHDDDPKADGTDENGMPLFQAERGPVQYTGFQANLNLKELGALTKEADGRHYQPVYVFLGDGEVHEVGKVDASHGSKGLARLLRMVADRMEQ